MMTAFLLTALIATTPVPVTGHWEGYLRRGVARLPVSFDFPAGDPRKGSFSAADLGALDIPLSKVNLGDSIGLRIEAELRQHALAPPRAHRGA